MPAALARRLALPQRDVLPKVAAWPLARRASMPLVRQAARRAPWIAPAPFPAQEFLRVPLALRLVAPPRALPLLSPALAQPEVSPQVDALPVQPGPAVLAPVRLEPEARLASARQARQRAPLVARLPPALQRVSTGPLWPPLPSPLFPPWPLTPLASRLPRLLAVACVLFPRLPAGSSWSASSSPSLRIPPASR